MNNCRAGLYSFASTTKWLHETGMASPPFLVMLGLTVPDSRVLTGIASIGLTLANIATILPHLRQPILDSIRAHKLALAHEQDMQGQISTPLVEPNSNPIGQYQSPPIACAVSVKSIFCATTEPLGCLNVNSGVASPATLLPPGGPTDGVQIHPQIHHSLGVDTRVTSSHLFAREGRNALHIPLPVPDAAEVAFFDNTSSDCDLGEESPATPCDQHTAPEERPTIEDDGRICGKDDQLVISDLSCTPRHIEATEEVTVVSMTAAENVAPSTSMNVGVRDHENPVVEGTAADHQDGQSARESHTPVGGKDAPVKRRPECLDFIPQSVIRRYPSTPMVSEGHCFVHRAISSRHDHHQDMAASPRSFVHNPITLLEEPRVGCMALERSWHASVSSEVHPTGRSLCGQAFIETAAVQGPLDPASPEISTAAKPPTYGGRLGVLDRAALRDRRLTAYRRMIDEIDGSSASDSDSDFDSDSQYSSGSSGDERMLPHILGADLIAAIDANSESGLHLSGSRRMRRTPLYVYEDFLMSENSAADVSMIMHAASIDEVTDSQVRVAGDFRSLTYEDIQQWASGVVQKCVRQVCRSRVPGEPSSPSQGSDICAERPSGSGVSQCPLAGLHCKLGAATLTGTPGPRIKEMAVGVPPTRILPSRKPLLARNLRDIPEFVPRQRRGSVMAKCGEGPGAWRRGPKPTMDVTRDAATQVIARVENRAGFNARQWLVGTEERRMASTAGGRQGTLRCA